MKKSGRIYLLVITTIVMIFAFAGIWYLRLGVPNELLEQARARQLQPLLEIDAPIRKPVAESVAQQTFDKKALAEELLPILTNQIASSLEGFLYEKLKKEFASDEAFVGQLSAKLDETLNFGAQTPEVAGTPAIPQGLQADFAKQVEALRTELLATLADGQSSFFFQIEDLLDARLGRVEDELTVEMQAYVPQLVDRMIPSLVEILVNELEANKATYLAKELKPHLVDSITEEEFLLLFTSYRDQIVANLVPAILAAMEEPAKKEVAEMVKAIKVPAAPVPSPSVTSVPKPEVKSAPVVETKPVPTPPVVVAETKVEPILAAPTSISDESEVFVDPVTYEEKRTEIRTKEIQDVLDRINAI